MKKEGFTLVELLAVMVVLGIVATIAVPQILSVVEDSKKGSFEDSATGLLEAAELYYTQYAGQELELDLSNKTIIKELNFKGTPPTGGTLYVNKEGDFALQMYNNKYCAYKSYSDRDVEIKEGACNFNNLWQISNENINSHIGNFPKVLSGITIDYNPETQIYTLNGTSTGTFMYSSSYIPKNNNLSQNYTLSIIYVSGTKTGATATVTLDLATKVNDNFAIQSTRQYIDVAMNNNNNSATKKLTYESNNVNNGYKLSLWISGANIVFKDYKFKVMLNTGSKQDWVKNLFTTN